MAPGTRGTISTLDFTTSVSINSVGLRGPEISAKTTDVFRILVLGDSFAFGWGVEDDETFAARLEKELKSEIPGIQVLNGAVPGFGLPDELEWLEHYGLHLEPDLVLLAIFPANDITDATERYRQEEIAFSTPEAGALRGMRLWLFRNSHFVRLMVRSNFQSLLGLPERWATRYFRSLLAAHTTDSAAAEAQEGRWANRAALAGFMELAERHRFQLTAIVIPAEFEIIPERWELMLATFRVDPAGLDPEAPRHFFNALLAEYNIPARDLWRLYGMGLQEGKHLYHPRDFHWTALGHDLAAHAIRDFLLEEDLLRKTMATPEDRR